LGDLDSQLDEDTRVKILEDCGRSCTPRSLVEKLKSVWGDTGNVDDFVDEAAKAWKHLRREGDGVYVEYERCYCPLVKDYAGELSDSWCNCSRGWLLELFGSATGSPVGVELLRSVRRGDDECRFQITF